MMNVKVVHVPTLLRVFAMGVWKHPHSYASIEFRRQYHFSEAMIAQHVKLRRKRIEELETSWKL
jgi:hypothetical protein